MTYSTQKKVACIGIGGGGVFYVAKFFLKLGVEVYGFDVSESERTKELQELGARITFLNPTEALEPGTTFFVYSPGLPNAILQDLENKNQTIEHKDVGQFTSELIHSYENNALSEKESNAFVESDIAPLFKLRHSKVTYIAVTGTDGKTSTTTMIYHILKKLGYKPGLISTVSAKVGDKDIDTGFHTTTPSAQDLSKLLVTMETEGCSHIIVETTSHGLAMGRLAGLKFHAIAYTNITNEHLDYHKTWENYYKAKESLLTEHTFADSFVVLNKDDEKPYQLLSQKSLEMPRKVITYSTTGNGDINGLEIEETPTVSFQVDGKEVSLPIIGRYNVSNALAAITLVSTLLKRSPVEVAETLKNFETVTGRMQILQTKPFTVIVDFAHTANALEQALLTMKNILPTGKKLITVFGCAGKRDDSKRYPMGLAAGKLADVTILTAEDPRSESLADINDEVEKGWRFAASKEKQLYRFDDASQLVEVRRQAIEKALSLAQEGDIILIAGKAHEQSLCFGNTEYPWSDIDETEKLLS